LKLVSIVEGHGDETAVPVLLRRLCAQLAPTRAVEVLRPIRLPRTQLEDATRLGRVVELAVRKAQPEGAVLLLMDADEACPVDLADRVRKVLGGTVGGVRKGLVFAQREFEAWFLASASSLAGFRGFPVGLQAPARPEEVAGAKEWLSRMARPSRYSETVDQPALAARMDLDQARACRSFRKLEAELERLLELAPG
jgi:hypothetical protein